MSEFLTLLVLFSIHAATVCCLFAMMFIQLPRRWWMRWLTAAMGFVAIVTPLQYLNSTLGSPNPWPESGEFEVLGWHTDEAKGAIFVFVDGGENAVPRHYKIPFKLETAVRLQEVKENIGAYRKISIRIEEGPKREEPRYEFTFEKAFADDAQIEVPSDSPPAQ